MADTSIYPFDTIVRIIEKSGNSYYQGSGVLVSPDEVLTASHLAWTTGIGVSTNITVSPGYASGSAPFGSIAGTVAHYNAISDAGGTIGFADIANDYALIHLSTPVSVGTMAIGADFSSGNVFISGYPASYAGAQVDMAEPLRTYSSGVLTGGSIGAGSSGGPLWTDAANNPTVVALVSAGDNSGNGYFPRITTAIRTQLLTWIAQDDGVQTVTSYTDTTTGASGNLAMSVATGGPAYLAWSTIWSSPDSVALFTSVPNSFLHGGAGADALQVTSGQNVLDGGTGSNFLIGGSGADTFFTDARGSDVVWSTLENFHAGDAATLWGFDAGVSSYYWEANPSGAPGATGATLRADIVGGAGRTGNGIDASITFAGLSVAQAQNLVISVGPPNAGAYLYFYNPGV